MTEAETPISSSRPRTLALAVLALAGALLLLYLLPVSFEGRAVDAETGRPLAGALVRTNNGGQTVADAEGRWTVRSSRFAGLSAEVVAEGYQAWQGPLRFPPLPLVPGRATLSLQPTVLRGAVVDGRTGQPVAAAQVAAGQRSAATAADGSFELRGLPAGPLVVEVAADGYVLAQRSLDQWAPDGSQPVQITLWPDGVHGTVQDEATGQPVAGARVVLGNVQATTDETGFFYLGAAAPGEATATAPGYLPVRLNVSAPAQLTGDEALTIALQPTVLVGAVVDGRNGQPLAGAQVRVGNQSAVTDAQGRFRLERLHGSGLTAEVTLTGYNPLQAPVDEATHLLAGQPLDLALLPEHLAGRAVNQATGSPLAGATVVAGGQTFTTDGEGVFRLWGLKPPLEITVSAPGFSDAQARFDSAEAITVALEPKGAVIRVTDAAGRPLVGAVVRSAAGQAVADAQGAALLTAIAPGDVFTTTLEGYAVVTATLTSSGQAVVSLYPTRVAGRAVDAVSGEPVLGAVVYAYDRNRCQGIACRGTLPVVYTDAAEDGTFVLDGLPPNPQLMVKAPGYRLHFPEAGEGECGAPLCAVAAMEPFEARGFYVPFHFLYDRALIRSRLDLIAQSPVLNAVVIDMKSDFGQIAWEPQNPIAREIGIFPANIMTAQEFLEEARQRGIYTIARFVTFKDNALAEGKPEWALRRKSNPTVLWKDGENLSWADPYRPEVRQYQMDLAKELSTLGFDEIQFDYFRFSGLRDHNQMTYIVESTPENRRQTISGFAHDLMRELKPYGIFTSIDVFGSIILNGTEPFIGQNLAEMSQGLDYLSPMIYPQVWWPGTFPGCDEPVFCPYKVIYDSVTTVRRIVPLPTRIRPWLQGYPKNFRTEGPARGYDYGVPEMMIQRQAAEDAGADGWLFWSGGGRFPDEIFGPMPPLETLQAQIRQRQGGRTGPY
ncbi:MAG: carboxypeptidase regulatory-like domain-containing protein [Caldilineales bacterium]|nr:carboxypeptidase regulatory-like domain-containing protein [Caldilineales bacterium]MDW8317020.1 putative glycoside hydrolase [Anaerolineae bacterium]